MNWNLFRSPTLRNALKSLFDTSTGHDHDGTNSKTLSAVASIEDGAVTNAKLATNAVGTSKILADAVTTAKILNANVTVDKMAADSVDSAQYVDGSIDNVHLAANSVDSDNYVDGSIDNVHLAADSVDSANYVDGSIDLAHMSANSVDSDQYVDASIDTVHLAATTSPTAKTIADPGTGIAIPVTGNGDVALTIGDAAETNTLAVPTFAGQIITISADTVAGTGSRVVTVASAINATGNDTITFDGAGDFISLYGIKLGASFAWRVLASDGATPITA